MQEEAFELADLISGYLLCTLTKEQEERLIFLLEEDNERYKLLEAYKDSTSTGQRLSNMYNLNIDQAWLKVQGHSKTIKISKKSNFGFLKYAAIFLAVICASIFYFNRGEKDPSIVPDLTNNYKNDVLPGTQKATLILSTGEKVSLDSGKLAISDESGVAIVSNNGKITYNDQKIKGDAEIQYNTLIVPKAGTYSVTLPDGSKVVLNAMSQLKYPVSFVGKDRRVELKGEGYFEVAKDAAHPFKVKLDKSEVEVLGTHFNVSAYDQNAKTTLLEGSVKVSNGTNAGLLIPGQQALVNSEGISIAKGDTDKAIAWVKGDFYFNNDALEPTLTEISRWYDLKLVYRKNLPNIHISGHISRQTKLSEVVKMLRDVSDISFKIENKNLVIN